MTEWNRECVICGHKWQGSADDDCKYCSGTNRHFDDWRPLTNRERLALAQQDAFEAWQALADGDYLRADLLLKLAIDEIADTGLLP
jgi:hypothetical protein